jgi:hypothetical protein
MSEDISGRYIHKKGRSNYIELKSDGTCTVYERDSGIAGTYVVDGEEIRIYGAGSTTTGQIRTGVIIDAEGEKWIRTDATDDPLASMTWLPEIVRSDRFPWELIDIAVVLFIWVLLIFVR